MRKGREMLGLPVIALAQATKVGVIRDLVIDPGRRAVVALLLAETRQQKPTRLALFDSVRRVGPDAVMIEDESAAAAAPERPEPQTLWEGPSKLVGLQVITDEGRTVGTVSDVVVDERSGSIAQYEISAGPFRDLVSGRVSVPATAPRAVGQEYMILPEAAVSDRRTRVEEGPPLVLETPPSQFIEMPAEEIERVAADLVVQQEDLIVGMRATKTIANEDAGGVICFQGEPISEETVEKAKAAGKLNQLVESAGEAAPGALSRDLAGRYARIAAGRMAGRTVHTTEGEILVAQGDVVTPEVVNRAREAGVLDQLVEAVRMPAGETFERRGGRHEVGLALWAQIAARAGRFRGRR